MRLCHDFSSERLTNFSERERERKRGREGNGRKRKREREKRKLFGVICHRSHQQPEPCTYMGQGKTLKGWDHGIALTKSTNSIFHSVHKKPRRFVTAASTLDAIAAMLSRPPTNKKQGRRADGGGRRKRNELTAPPFRCRG